jgi:peroxiredoxin
MKKHKWYSILIIGLPLVLAGLLIACAEEPEVGLEIGNTAPDFTLQTIDDKTITLSDFRGKIVMVNMWLTECKGCVDEMAHIQAVFDKWSDEELIILAINTTDSAVTVKEFVNRGGFTFPILVDPRGQASGDYCKFGAPTTFFIDGKGIVRAIQQSAFLSPDEIESLLEALQSS